MGVCLLKDHQLIRPTIGNRLTASHISNSVILDSTIHLGIHKFYHFTGILGHGQFGTVREAYLVQKESSIRVAIKSIPKSKIKGELHMLKRELDILRLVDHPNIIKFYETYEDEKYLHLVMELCTGGDLFEYFLRSGSLSEEKVATYMRKLLMAANHLHSLAICHRDLKPENFLFVSSEPNSELKVIDFGMSNKFGADISELTTMVGTPYYLAPEVLTGRYGKECDIWSLGVVMFLLLSGRQPFSGVDLKEIFRKVVGGEYDFKGVEWASVSLQAKDLISRMIKIKTYQRITIEEALRHPWFTEVTRVGGGSVPLRVLNSLKRYKAPSKLQQEAMKIILLHFSTDEINDLKEAFLSIDREKTGFITASDIEVAMKHVGFDMASEEIHRIFHIGLVSSMDYLNLGKVKYSDFLVATIDRRKYLDEEMLYFAFTRFDSDHDGAITLEDLRQALIRLNNEIPEADAREMIEEWDENRDKRIDFNEFKCMMQTLTATICASRPISRNMTKQNTLTLLAGQLM